MHNFDRLRTSRLLAGAALLMLASIAQAQYVWVDAKGFKQFSDRPPPASVPMKSILKSPAPLQLAADTEVTMISPQPFNPTAPSVAQREAESRKRKEEQSEADQKASAAEKAASVKANACREVRSNKAGLDSGKRVRAPDGGWLDEKQIAELNAAATKALNEHCI